MKQNKDFTIEIEAVKEDLVKVEQDIAVYESVLVRLKEHRLTLEFFLETISE